MNVCCSTSDDDENDDDVSSVVNGYCSSARGFLGGLFMFVEETTRQEGRVQKQMTLFQSVYVCESFFFFFFK